MKYAEFCGTHYEAGCCFGRGVLAREHNILENIPFPLSAERLSFSAACLPVYRRFYPEILDEIQGIADAQSADAAPFYALLFSMYAIPPMCSCSCFAYADGDEILFARNSDFLSALERNNLNVLYRLSGSAYAFTGNTTAFAEIEDGINEHGLAVGMTSVFPAKIKPGFHAGFLVRYLLEKCRTVRDALAALQALPIASAQTLTLADVSGDIALVECDCERLEIARPSHPSPPFVCAVNSFHSPSMSAHNVSLSDGWFAEERFQTMRAALGCGHCSVDYARRLLAGEFGFMCQYEPFSGKATVWSVICDLKRRRLYRADGNPAATAFQEDTRLQF